MEFKIYSRQTIITNPRQFIDQYKDLPASPKELLKIVQGLIIHGDQGKLYNTTFSKRQMDEELLRTIPQMLEKLLQIGQRAEKLREQA